MFLSHQPIDVCLVHLSHPRTINSGHSPYSLFPNLFLPNGQVRIRVALPSRSPHSQTHYDKITYSITHDKMRGFVQENLRRMCVPITTFVRYGEYLVLFLGRSRITPFVSVFEHAYVFGTEPRPSAAEVIKQNSRNSDGLGRLASPRLFLFWCTSVYLSVRAYERRGVISFWSALWRNFSAVGHKTSYRTGGEVSERASEQLDVPVESFRYCAGEVGCA